jgi:hypothetical protein
VHFAIGWGRDWVWSLPLIVFTLSLHVIGLAFINASLARLHRRRDPAHVVLFFILIMGVTAPLATMLHTLEAAVWAAAYVVLGALQDFPSAMLYSLGAVTAYGHADVHLEPHWSLMGALEALTGLLAFGLTTAFLYGHLQRALPVEQRVSERASTS